MKANSIEGSKKSQVNVVYTFASNLLKTNDMETGSVSYKKMNLKVRRFAFLDF